PFGVADLADELEHAVQRGARFEGAFGGALDGWAVGERIAERNAEVDDIGTAFRESLDELESSTQGRVAGRDVGDDAHFTGLAKVGETPGDAGRDGGCGGQSGMK